MQGMFLNLGRTVLNRLSDNSPLKKEKTHTKKKKNLFYNFTCFQNYSFKIILSKCYLISFTKLYMLLYPIFHFLSLFSIL